MAKLITSSRSSRKVSLSLSFHTAQLSALLADDHRRLFLHHVYGQEHLKQHVSWKERGPKKQRTKVTEHRKAELLKRQRCTTTKHHYYCTSTSTSRAELQPTVQVAHTESTHEQTRHALLNPQRANQLYPNTIT
eukprot:scpid20340/ scgid27960/ 